ncbi:hypothetical protein ES703_111723 [subsurface metagenome]
MRIFTKRFAITPIPQAATTSETYNARETWTVQEDIEIIGAQIHILAQGQLGNDGFTVAIVEFSQSGKYDEDGVIIKAGMTQEWNTSPAFGHSKYASENVMFPRGLAIPVREEGIVHVNLQVVAIDLTAGSFVVGAGGTIYYTKKGTK